MEHMIVPMHYAPVPKLGTGKEVKVKKVLLLDASIDEKIKQATIQIPQLITIPAKTESLLVIVTSKFGLMTIEKIQTAKPTQRKLPAQGVHQVCTNVPFPIFVTSVLEEPVVFHKLMCNALGTGPPECILVLQQDGESKVTADVNSVNHNEEKDRQTLIKRQIRVENEHAKQKVHKQ